MGKKSGADASFEETQPSEVGAMGVDVLLTASLLDKLKTAYQTK